MKKAKQILAIIGLLAIAASYITTIIFALMKNPASHNWLMASIFCTIAVPIFIYAVLMVAKVLSDRNKKDNE